MKEKKTHAKAKKPPMFDFTPLKSRGLRVMMVACAFAALGIYAPVFYLVSYKFFNEICPNIRFRYIKDTKRDLKTVL
jgi:hypothetical protein